ncbi:ABC transporter permease [Abyssisolibacter fermentans]|uniref:ABC transporter permease n=1 Tax=Abyssisolibacter fermentans TaxID=1766203 RepID=UPI0008327528|nr:ABC transporter permease [Abyssisolibacter fermentans]
MINPVLKRELKTKGRSFRTTLMMIFYILIISSVMSVVLYTSNSGYNSYMGFDPESIKEIYFGISILQMALICLIIPATTSGSICGERQRKTFNLLICTKMSSWSIVLGKLFASMIQTILLLILTIPIISILFLYGGLSIGNIILLFLFYLVTAILLGSIGLFSSAYFKKAVTATVTSYFVMLLLTVGTIYVVTVGVRIFDTELTLETVKWIARLLYINPFTGLTAILSQQLGADIFLGDIANITFIKRTIIYNLSFDLLFSFLLLYLTTLKINPMKGIKIFK